MLIDHGFLHPCFEGSSTSQVEYPEFDFHRPLQLRFSERSIRADFVAPTPVRRPSTVRCDYADGLSK